MGRKCFSFRTPHFRTPFRTDFHENVRNEEHFLHGDSPLKIKNLKSGFLHAREDQKIGPEPKCHVPRFSKWQRRSTIYEIVDYFCHQGMTDRRDERNEHYVITSADKNSREGNDIMRCHSE